MEILDAIHRRRAVRDYKPEKVPVALLRRVIEAASWAPSAMNEQPWHFTAMTDRTLMGEISTHAKLFMLKSVAAMPRSGHFQVILGDPHFNIFYNAPALLVISTEAQGQWCVEDCALAAENAMLAAFDLGLGSCWIGFAQGWLNSAAGLEALGLPRGHRVVAPIIMGYPKIEPPPVARKSPAIHWLGDSMTAEEKIPAMAAPGLYGTLIHP
jgi:nitroreductase